LRLNWSTFPYNSPVVDQFNRNWIWPAFDFGQNPRSRFHSKPVDGSSLGAGLLWCWPDRGHTYESSTAKTGRWW
jgi:hypothetical protein